MAQQVDVQAYVIVPTEEEVTVGLGREGGILGAGGQNNARAIFCIREWRNEGTEV
jgi:hypothetical protein